MASSSGPSTRSRQGLETAVEFSIRNPQSSSRPTGRMAGLDVTTTGRKFERLSSTCLSTTESPSACSTAKFAVVPDCWSVSVPPPDSCDDVPILAVLRPHDFSCRLYLREMANFNFNMATVVRRGDTLVDCPPTWLQDCPGFGPSEVGLSSLAAFLRPCQYQPPARSKQRVWSPYCDLDYTTIGP